MTTVEHVKNSVTLVFHTASFHLHLPILGDSDSTTVPFCISKASGELRFTLTSDDLGLPIPNLKFDFWGNEIGSEITWKVDQDLDIWDSGFHITHVRGQIVTNVESVQAVRGDDCHGEPRVYQATLKTIGNNNTLTIETSAGDTIVSNITINVDAGETLSPVQFDVRIHPDKTPHDECGHYYQIKGTTVRFTASVINLQAIGNVTNTTYQWDIPAGVTPLGGTNKATLEIQLNTAGSVSLTVHVIVVTDIEVGTQQSTTTFAVLTPDEAVLLSQICHLLSMTLPRPSTAVVGIGHGFTAGGTRFVDPLWDPPPNEMNKGVAILRRGYSLHELHQVRRVAERIAHAASVVVSQTSQVITEREAHREQRSGR